MAITFGTPIGSNSNGGFAILPADVEAGDVVTLLVVGEGGNVYDGEPVPDAFTITSLQAAAIQALLGALIDGAGDYEANQLAYLRKMVGIVSLTDGQTITLSTDTVTIGSNDVTVLNATCAEDGTVVMYVPNSASSGLYTGIGAEEGGGPAPTASRQEYVANVPGLYLQDVACLVAPNFGAAVTIDPALCGGFAQTPGATATRSFLVEKTTINAPAAVGAGDQLFLLDFATGDNAATISGETSANYEIATGELLRIVNPGTADADLADVAISLVGTLA
jgi:hypothetical protein